MKFKSDIFFLVTLEVSVNFLAQYPLVRSVINLHHTKTQYIIFKIDRVHVFQRKMLNSVKVNLGLLPTCSISRRRIIIIDI